MSIVTIGGKKYYEKIEGTCPNPKCAEGPGSGVITDCECENGIIKFCSLCGSKLKVKRSLKKL